MKKTKLSIGLVTGLIGVMAMSACGSNVTKSDKAVVTFKGYDGQTACDIITDDMYDKYLDSTDGIVKYYNQILEVLIRNEFNNDKSDVNKKVSKGRLENEAKSDVEDQKKSAEEASKTNNTSYKKEWKAILDSNDAKDEAELLDKFIYNKEKEEIKKWFADEHYDEIQNEFIGIKKVDDKWQVAEENKDKKSFARLPYHIRHILVNVAGDEKNYTTQQITKEQAGNLYNVVKDIKDGKLTFGAIAKARSEDKGTAEKYGDAGIVTNKAEASGSVSMVNEFQLGIYAYDALLAHDKKTVDDATKDVISKIKDGLGLEKDFENVKEEKTEKVNEAYNEISGGIAKVPYSVFEDLNKYKETEKINDHVVYDGDEMIYPRNILWNKYLNRHNVFLITNNARSYGGIDGDYKNINRNDNVDMVGSPITDETDVNYKSAQPGACGFRDVKDILSLKDSKFADDNAGLKVLTDEAGRVIVGVRSTYGIHFMIIQKSIFEFASSESSVKYVPLNEYYTRYVPKESDKKYPKDEKGDYKDTYVNYQDSDDAGYRARAEEVESAVKAVVSGDEEYRLYDYLYENNKDKLKFRNDIDVKINDYINKKRLSNLDNQDEYLAKAWANYLELLQLQKEERANKERMVPEGCIIGFDEDNKINEDDLADYYKKGVCYYGSK